MTLEQVRILKWLYLRFIKKFQVTNTHAGGYTR